MGWLWQAGLILSTPTWGRSSQNQNSKGKSQKYKSKVKIIRSSRD